MLQCDEVILNILLDEKSKGNELLRNFHISFPSKRIAQESNNIFVGVVDTEHLGEGLEFSRFRDMVEILIVTKNKNYKDSVKIIKTVSKEIIHLLYLNEDKFDNRPVIRNITPEYGVNFVVSKGHILIQVNTAPESFEVGEEDRYAVCELLTNDIQEV